MKKKVETKAKKKSNVIQLYPAHKGKKPRKQEPLMEVGVIGELQMFDLNFQIGIQEDHFFILGFMCSCGHVHPIETEEFSCRMDSRNYTPAEYLAAMMPYICNVVKARMFDLDIIVEI